MSRVLFLVCFCLIFGGELASARRGGGHHGGHKGHRGRPGRMCDSTEDICRYINVTGTTLTIDHIGYTTACRCFSSEGPGENGPPGCEWLPEGGFHGHRVDRIGRCQDMAQVCLYIDHRRQGKIITWENSATFSCKCHSAEGPSENGPVGCNWEAPTGLLLPED
ncbi:uncharacterized protein LOC106170301 [Lingula anatina]|uniref:Uncharacterized protein LOC106170301 n=1 Tax=Lingula anatina TaxID=7574 RepID=A0A1S3J5A6_LINAN|nr:uncharacterized protein LOC106170301 [Lingula anatina]|eukprot:XP_013405565.1 uncharacterized protein LOC106170301 [Lingula anatina]